MKPSSTRFRMRRAAVLAAACLSSACAAPPAEVAPTVAPAPAPLPELAWTADVEPADAAARIAVACASAGEARQACQERALLGVLNAAGVARSMQTLAALAQADPAVQREGHVYAHAIGIAAYRAPDSAAETFAACTPEYQSGCYHGVIQAYFADPSVGARGLDAEALNALCAPYREPERQWLQFQCVHGMGHGLMAVHDNHLLRALDACDLLETFGEREGCYGGAFMENIVAATQPHHGASHHAADHAQTPAADDAHGDHHAHHTAGGEPFPPLDDDDPLYPCTVVRGEHRVQCYLMQTSAILFRNGGDFAAAAEACAGAPEPMRGYCFVSLGRDAASWSDQRHAAALEMCGHATGRYRDACIAGLVKNLVDRTADSADGLAFCRDVPDAAGKTACYRAVGEQVAILETGTAAREARCADAEAEYAAACRTGAGVQPARSEQPGRSPAAG
jgi:hypothetical protein